MFAFGRPVFSKITLVIILVIALISVGVLPFLSDAAGEPGTLTFRVGSIVVKTTAVDVTDGDGVLFSLDMLPSEETLAAALPENADVIGWRATTLTLESATPAGSARPAENATAVDGRDGGVLPQNTATILVPMEDPYIYTGDLTLVAQYPGIYRAIGDFVISGETVFDAVLGAAQDAVPAPDEARATDGPVLVISDESGRPLTDLMIGLDENKRIHVSVAGLQPTENHVLAITIPEGLTAVSYEGFDGAALPTGIQHGVSLRAEPSAVTLPGQPVSARFGDIIYDISQETAAAEFNIVVAVDRSRFYGSHALSSPINAAVTGQAFELSGALRVYAEATATFSEQIVPSQTTPYMIAVNGVEAETAPAAVFRYFGDAAYPVRVPVGNVTFSYPETATLSGVFYDASHVPNGTVPQDQSGNIYGGPGGNEHIVHDADARTVTFYYENTQLGNLPRLRLVFAGERFGTIRDIPVHMAYTAYDGTPVVLANDGSGFRFQIMGDTNLLAVEGSWSAAPTDLPGLTLVGRIRFENPQATGIANQIVRYSFPRELNVRAFDVPTEDNSSPVSVQYKVYGDPVPRVSVSRESVVNPDPQGGKLCFSPVRLGLRTGEIIEWAEAEVGDFSADYQQEHSTVSGCMIFGNIAPGAEIGTTYAIPVTIRPEGESVTAIPVEIVVNAVTTVDAPANAILLNVTMDLSRNGTYRYAAGEEIRVHAKLGFPPGTATGTIQRIANPDMYILLPKDVSIASESLMLTMSGRNVLRDQDGLEAFLLQDGSERTLLRVHSDTVIGQMASDLQPYGDLELFFGMVGAIGMAPFATDFSGLVFGGPAANDPLILEESDDCVRVVDSLDLDGDGDTTEYIIGVAGALLDFVIAAPDGTPPHALPNPADSDGSGGTDTGDAGSGGSETVLDGAVGASIPETPVPTLGKDGLQNSSSLFGGANTFSLTEPAGNVFTDSAETSDAKPAPEAEAQPPAMGSDVEPPEATVGIGSAGVPLSTLAAVNVWSLLSMILAFISVLISVLLSIEAVVGKKNATNPTNYGTYYEQEETRKIQKQRGMLRNLAIIAGFLTLTVWLISDDPLLPMAWINRWTILVVVIFIVHVALFIEFKLQSNDAETECYDGSDGMDKFS